MLKNGILEISYVNPLTSVQRTGKPTRICVDAGEMNEYMIPDRAKVPPIQELLLRFCGATFISSIDLNSTFLQLPLERTSRESTAFHFEGQVYQFARVPYG
jgi:hypothetical protein